MEDIEKNVKCYFTVQPVIYDHLSFMTLIYSTNAAFDLKLNLYFTTTFIYDQNNWNHADLKTWKWENFEQIGKVREFYTKYWRKLRILTQNTGKLGNFRHFFL